MKLLSIYHKKYGINNFLFNCANYWSKFVILLIQNVNIMKRSIKILKNLIWLTIYLILSIKLKPQQDLRGINWS